MKKSILNVKGAKEVSKNKQKDILGGALQQCGGDGSYIYVNGKRVCCYQPWSGLYIC